MKMIKKDIFLQAMFFFVITFITGILYLKPFVNFIIFILGMILISLLYKSKILRKLIYVLVFSITISII